MTDASPTSAGFELFDGSTNDAGVAMANFFIRRTPLSED